MSHELRTPLNSLLLLAQSFVQNKDGNLTEDQIEAARVIHGSGSDLLDLINEILDLSKIEAGRMELDLGPVFPEEIAAGLRGAFAHMAEAKGLAFEVSVARGLPAQIVTDRKRLDQILRNLVSNALKFTERGGVKVGLAAADGAERPDTLAVTVHDSGIGIPEEKQRLIFEAFQQADGTTTRRFGGTGLGLTISRELAGLLGGSILVESREGEGATFTLYVPMRTGQPGGARAAKAPPVRAGQPRQSVTAPAAPAVSTAPFVPDDRETVSEDDWTILVIEDDPRFASILVNTCHDKGLKCIAAPTGEAGMELVARYKPKGVILDIRLPGIDGMSVLAGLKEDIRTRHIPVHMVSVDDHRHESLRKGAVGHAVKPLGQQELESVFDRLREVSSERPKRVLVVEDDPVIRRDTVALIGIGDVEVDEVVSGEEALQALRSAPYDCVVLDLKLPDVSGKEILERLENEKVALPPVVVHTARELSAEEEQELREHADSIVVKDVRSPERLLDEVSLFLHRVVSQMPEPQRRIIHDLYDSDAMLRGKKALIVDDDMRTTFALARLLAEQGIEALKAENGERALEVLEQHPDVDIVLMDVMMPVMDGYETMQRIRAQDRFGKLPILALTAKAMQEDRAKCLESGANDYLPKPVDMARLFSLMRVWLHA
jgi:CheY-like chemotaxis protein